MGTGLGSPQPTRLCYGVLNSRTQLPRHGIPASPATDLVRKGHSAVMYHRDSNLALLDFRGCGSWRGARGVCCGWKDGKGGAGRGEEAR